jgi:hypothetical protein
MRYEHTSSKTYVIGVGTCMDSLNVQPCLCAYMLLSTHMSIAQNIGTEPADISLRSLYVYSITHISEETRIVMEMKVAISLLELLVSSSWLGRHLTRECNRMA